jgi:hypothetical protein
MPDRHSHAIYRELMPVYIAREAHALANVREIRP